MVFISKTANYPFEPLTGVTLEESVTIGPVQTLETVVTEQKPLYLVVIDDWFDILELKVENEHATGVSLYISLVDPMDQPIHWGKLITLNDVYAKMTTYVKKFVYRWHVVNNLYFVRETTPTAKINVYGTKIITT